MLSVIGANGRSWSNLVEGGRWLGGLPRLPEKERAGMKRNPSQTGPRGLADELAALRGLDTNRVLKNTN